MRRNIFIGRASEKTYPEVIKYGYFADKYQKFYENVKKGDIGFLVVHEKKTKKDKKITKIIGPFIAKGDYNQNNDLRQLELQGNEVPRWRQQFPYYVEVEAEKCTIIMGQKLQRVIGCLPDEEKHIFKKAIISQDSNYQDFIIELFLNIIT